MKVHIITIGDEILIGQIVDTNSAWIATQLNLCGIEVTEIKTVGDNYADIQSALNSSTASADVVLMTGGLGATKDDITKKAIANFMGVEMVFDEELYVKIATLFQKRNIPMTEAMREQCYMPKTMLHLENKMGTAPGMWFDYEKVLIVALPGIPYEMKHLMETQVLPRLKQRVGVAPICHRTLLTSGYGEVQLAEKIEPILQTFPPYMKIAYLPNLGEVRLRISAYGKEGDDEKDLVREVEEKVAAIENLLEHSIYGQGKGDIQSALGKILTEKKWTLATAESCTGGNITAKIVKVAGASQYFKGGVIAYSNKIKKEKLGVSQKTLDEYGAVSEETVREMLQGVLLSMNADVGIAVSGIIGPSGGSKDKPVGTIWIAVGNKEDIQTHQLLLSKDRWQSIEYTSKRALNLLRLFLVS